MRAPWCPWGVRHELSPSAAATSVIKAGQHCAVVWHALSLSAQPGGRSLSHGVEVGEAGGLLLLGNFTSKPIVQCQQPLQPANPQQKGTRQAGGGTGLDSLISESMNVSQQAISVLK